MYLVDTNIFIYALFDVDKSKQKKCIELLKNASIGKIDLWTTEWVIAELVWFYAKQKIGWLETKKVIESILTSKGLVVRKSSCIWEIMENCTKHDELVDGINMRLAIEENVGRGYSYDKGLDKWTGFERLEP